MHGKNVGNVIYARAVDAVIKETPNVSVVIAFHKLRRDFLIIAIDGVDIILTAMALVIILSQLE